MPESIGERFFPSVHPNLAVVAKKWIISFLMSHTSLTYLEMKQSGHYKI